MSTHNPSADMHTAATTRLLRKLPTAVLSPFKRAYVFNRATETGEIYKARASRGFELIMKRRPTRLVLRQQLSPSLSLKRLGECRGPRFERPFEHSKPSTSLRDSSATLNQCLCASAVRWRALFRIAGDFSPVPAYKNSGHLILPSLSPQTMTQMARQQPLQVAQCDWKGT